MGAALNMLAAGEAEVSDASLPNDCIGYGISFTFTFYRLSIILIYRYN